MGLVERLDAAIARFDRGHEYWQAASDEMTAIVREASTAAPAVHESLTAALAARFDHEHPVLGAHLALLAGALVETGIRLGSVGSALLVPLERTLVAAQRFVELANEHAGDGDGDPKRGLFVGDKYLSEASLAALSSRDVEAVRAFESLQTWYRPAVALWTRDRATLRRAQAEPTLRAAVEALAKLSQGAFWLATLLDVCIEVPFVVLIPELQEAWELIVDGCVDNEQLLTLLSEALCPSLRRLGVAAPAPAAVLAIARGDGPQQAQSHYSAAFQIYAWQAIDRDSGWPVNGRFVWHSPGGRGDSWLPGDFRPSRVVPLEGKRVVALVKSSMTRVISAARLFESLPASIANVRQLSASEAKRWTDIVAPNFFVRGREIPKRH